MIKRRMQEETERERKELVEKEQGCVNLASDLEVSQSEDEAVGIQKDQTLVIGGENGEVVDGKGEVVVEERECLRS